MNFKNLLSIIEQNTFRIYSYTAHADMWVASYSKVSICIFLSIVKYLWYQIIPNNSIISQVRNTSIPFLQFEFEKRKTTLYFLRCEYCSILKQKEVAYIWQMIKCCSLIKQ